MADVQISIHPEEARLMYRPGETVRGTVRLETPGGSVRARKVLLECTWATSGKGDTDRGHAPGSPIELLPGPSIQGPLEVPFSVTLPLAPCSYTGVLVKIGWSLNVRVDEPWAKDSKFSLPIVVA